MSLILFCYAVDVNHSFFKYFFGVFDFFPLKSSISIIVWEPDSSNRNAFIYALLHRSEMMVFLVA